LQRAHLRDGYENQSPLNDGASTDPLNVTQNQLVQHHFHYALLPQPLQALQALRQQQ
jgi:hypothetical protein